MKSLLNPKLKLMGVVVICLLWVSAAFAGLRELLLYEQTPGTQGSQVLHWPKNSSLKLSATLPTLITVLHPKCSCSDATIESLTQILTEVREKVHPIVVFSLPENTHEELTQTSLWDQTRKIPGVEIFTDKGGIESARFGSYTSGETLLYTTSGQLVFEGGITAGRGHHGVNFSSETLIKAISKSTQELQVRPVFGCDLVRAKGAS